MLRVHSSPRQLCTGMTRRELLEVGGTSLLGLSLPQLLASDAARAAEAKAAPDRSGKLPDGFGSAKRSINLTLYPSRCRKSAVASPAGPQPQMAMLRSGIRPQPSCKPSPNRCTGSPAPSLPSVASRNCRPPLRHGCSPAIARTTPH